MPLVSIITPNRGPFELVEACHRVVRRQTFEDWEHIIIDDGSGPDVGHRLRRLAETDQRIVPIASEVNQGAGPARNLGLEHARGRYLAFLDIDDEWDADKLSVQYDFMSSQGVKLSHGAYRIATAGQMAEQAKRVLLPPERVGYAQLLRSCPIGCLTVMGERRVFERFRFANIRRGQDWALWLRMTADGTEFIRYPGVHATYRRQSGSLSSAKLAKLRDTWRIYRHQEGLSFLKAQWFVARHAYSVMTRPYEWQVRD